MHQSGGNDPNNSGRNGNSPPLHLKDYHEMCFHSTVEISIAEIYNERVRDLLASNPEITGLLDEGKHQEDRDSRSALVEGKQTHQPSSPGKGNTPSSQRGWISSHAVTSSGGSSGGISSRGTSIGATPNRKNNQGSSTRSSSGLNSPPKRRSTSPSKAFTNSLLTQTLSTITVTSAEEAHAGDPPVLPGIYMYPP